MDEGLLVAALRNRAFCYRYAWRLFAAEPDVDLLGVVAGEVASAQVRALTGEDSRGASAQRHLAELAVSADLDALSAEYTRLFVGPARPASPLWESVYRDPDGLLFQQSTLDVRGAYASAGFRASAYPKEADDHLAIELDFMATLASRAADSAERGDMDRASLYLRHAEAFLADHLNRWLEELYDALSRTVPESVGNFYIYAVVLAIELCKTDSEILGELLAASAS